MRKRWISIFFMCCLLMSLNGCMKYTPDNAYKTVVEKLKNTILDKIKSKEEIIPDVVTIENTTYITGFYNGLYPYFDKNYVDDSKGFSVIDETEYHTVADGVYDMVVSEKGFDGYTIYCEEKQVEKVKKYYSDSNNFDYYCGIGWQAKPAYDVSDIDKLIFNQLINFAEKNSYDPFDSEKNEAVKTFTIPFPEEQWDTHLRLYKCSKDGIFGTGRGYLFHVLDDKLILVFYYSGANNEESLFGVQVPDDLSDYMVNYLKGKIPEKYMKSE